MEHSEKRWADDLMRDFSRLLVNHFVTWVQEERSKASLLAVCRSGDAYRLLLSVAESALRRDREAAKSRAERAVTFDEACGEIAARVAAGEDPFKVAASIEDNDWTLHRSAALAAWGG